MLVLPSFLAIAGLATGGCALEPIVKTDPVSKAVETPSHFKGLSERGQAPRPEWWKLFHDSRLDELVARLDSDNFELRAGMARIDRARAVIGVARAEGLPLLNGEGAVTRNRISEGSRENRFFDQYFTRYDAGLALGWELDLWGRVRHLVDANEAEAAAVARAVEDLRLSLRSQVARNYFALRFLDEERRVLQGAVESRQENLKIATDRFEGGRTGELDVARAETELAVTKAELARLAGSRTRLENAIAVLVGEPPSTFRIEQRPPSSRLPVVRPGLPVQVLENRPDVAEAIARLDAANSRVGVAKAEFFPKVSLVGNGGLSSIEPNDFLTWTSRNFAFGPEISLPIFQGGRLRGNLASRRAEQEEALSNYQQTVLEAFQDVEDALADLAALRNEKTAQSDAVAASNRALDLSEQRYREGLVSSIEVVDAIREQLDAERRAVQIQGQQHEATVRLIQAIGGGLAPKHVK